MPIHPIRVAALAAALLLSTVATAVASPRQDRVERAVVDALSRTRAAHGLHALRSHRALARVADRHSRSMARSGVLTHGAWARRMRGVTRGAAGETIAVIPGRSRRLARRAVRSWMHSPPHRAVLLDPRVRRIGVARRHSSRGWFITADVAAGLRRGA